MTRATSDEGRAFPPERDVQYSRIYIGAAWPRMRPGFGVVVGESAADYWLGRPRLEVLDECRHERLWEFVHQVVALAQYYHPERICADGYDVAACGFVDEISQGRLRIEHAPLCGIEAPMAYALPLLARMYDSTQARNRLVIPAAFMLLGELRTVDRMVDPAKMELRDYPGVAALAFAVLSLDSTWRARGERLPTETV